VRLFDLDSMHEVELWPGRRMYFTDDDGVNIVNLPRGAMTTLKMKRKIQLNFGNASGTTVQINGPAAEMSLLAAAIVDLERPKAAAAPGR